jgi:hypothetical protein
VPFLLRCQCVRGAEHWSGTGGGCASGYRSSTRGWAPKARATGHEQARDTAPEGGRIARRISLALRTRPRPRAVVFLALSSKWTGERASSSCVFPPGRTGGLTPAPEREPLARQLIPEPFGAFCGEGPIGVPGLAAGNGTGNRSQRVDPKVALRGVPTEVGPGAQDTQREHDDTSHGVRFLSAR